MYHNTEIEYSYRDACNYKKYNTVILQGRLTYEDIEPFLHEGEFFIPSVIGLDDLQDQTFNVYDHIWHGIYKISETKLIPNVKITANKLLLNFKEAQNNNWYEYEVYKRKGLV